MPFQLSPGVAVVEKDFTSIIPAVATSAGAFAGDPLLATYSDADLEIINAAAKSVGAGRVNKLTDNRSTEHEAVHKASPIKGFGGYK